MQTESPANSPPPEPELSLAEYAAVKASVAEGFPLAEVLTVEKVSSETWTASDTAWKQRLVADEAAFAKYRQELAGAEDWLTREVAPVSKDLRAWLCLLDAYGAAPDSSAYLSGLGLGLNDLSRLQRSWDKRMKEDPEIEKRIASVRRGLPAPLPALAVAPRVLRQSRASLAKEAAKPSVAAVRQPLLPMQKTAATADLGLNRYAAITAQVELKVADLDQALKRLGVASKEALTELQHQWQRRFDRDPTLVRDFRILVGLAKQQVQARKGASPDNAGQSPKPGGVASPKLPTGTALAFDGPRGPALPFVPAVPAPPPVGGSVQGPPKPPVPRPISTGTSLAVGPAPSEVLPFSDKGKGR